MARALRIEFERAVYHVMARGQRRAPIVMNESDQELWVQILGEAAERFGWKIFACADEQSRSCVVGHPPRKGKRVARGKEGRNRSSLATLPLSHGSVCQLVDYDPSPRRPLTLTPHPDPMMRKSSEEGARCQRRLAQHDTDACLRNALRLQTVAQVSRPVVRRVATCIAAL
jgi:hypothetical protein